MSHKSRLSADEMVRLYREDGLSLGEVGERAGVTRQRVHQIFRRLGVRCRPQQMVDRVEWVCQGCGKVRRLRPKKAAVQKYCSRSCGARQNRRYTDEDLLNRLRTLAVRLGRTPGQRDLAAADGPTARVYLRRFGSLRDAQRLAGLEPNRSGRPPKRREVAA